MGGNREGKRYREVNENMDEYEPQIETLKSASPG